MKLKLPFIAILLFLMSCSNDEPQPSISSSCAITTEEMLGSFKLTKIMHYLNGVYTQVTTSDVACQINGIYTFNSGNSIVYSGNIWNTGSGNNCIPVTNATGKWYLNPNGHLSIVNLADGVGYALKTSSGFDWIAGSDILTFVKQ